MSSYSRHNYIHTRMAEIKRELTRLAPALSKQTDDLRADAIDNALINYAGELDAEFQDLHDELGVIGEAIDLAIQYGQTDGAHHKAWVIDQMVRLLAGSEYDEIIKQACDGEDGPNTYSWDTGIAP